jgi:hypothetical protein
VKFLCLVYHDEKKLEAMDRDEWNALIDATEAFRDRHQESGHFLIGNPLEPVRETRTVRVRNRGVSITDGPFTETKEHLGGFFLIEARDLNEAIHVASQFPPAQLGTLEIRPIRELEHLYRGAVDRPSGG